MNAQIPANLHDSLEELSIMTFSIMGTRMGVDVEQVSRMIEPGQAQAEEIRIVALHEGLCFPDRNIAYRSPRILLLRDRENTGIMIDEPEDILAVRVDSIRPLPAVLEAHMQTNAVWAIALIGDEIVLLLDLLEFEVATRLPH